MLRQLAILKRFFSIPELLGQMSSMKRVRAPLRGYLTTLCFWSLMEVGVLESLAGGRSSRLADLAGERELDPEILGFVCQYLCRLGYLEERSGAVVLSRKGRRFWRDAESVLRLFHGYQPLFDSLVAQLRGEARFGRDLFRREESVAAAFSELGRSFIFPIMEQILVAEGFRGMVELGCAGAELSRYVCARNPSWSCLGIDASKSVLDAARSRVEEQGLQGRIELAEADIFRIGELAADLSRYDVVTAIDLFHGFFLDGEEDLIEMFRGLRSRFSSQKFLISEICLPSERRISRISYPNVEHELYHGLTRQKSFRPGELEGLLGKAGFQVERSWNVNDVAGRMFLLLDPLSRSQA